MLAPHVRELHIHGGHDIAKPGGLQLAILDPIDFTIFKNIGMGQFLI